MAEETDVPFGANEVRLSPREWIVALILSAISLYLVPIAWRRAEPLQIETDHRVPHSLSEDYWLYDRYCRWAAGRDKTLVLGDSVVWGHYVNKDQTLSHYLNELAGGERFVNVGVDGIHPAALAGLVRYHGKAISGRDVILHCNLLWMSSKRADLQSTKETPVNHPRLLPQFFPSIPCYGESLWGRIDILARRHLSFLGWAEHMQRAYLGRHSILQTGEVVYWPAFCAKLAAPDATGVSRRIGELLPESARLRVLEISREQEIDESSMSKEDVAREKVRRAASRAYVVKAVNRIVKWPYFYRAEAFGGIDLPAEAKDLLGRNREALSAAKVRRLNRLLLEAAYPEQIAEARSEPGKVVRWPTEHPYEIPYGAWLWGLPSPDESPSPKPDARPWIDKGGQEFNPPWVELDKSFQWACFKQTVGILRSRGNRVFVLLGPFNEHMLKNEALAAYQNRKQQVESWLQEQKIPHDIPPPLPTERYADASHPLAEGYAALARNLFESESFVRFDAPRRAGRERKVDPARGMVNPRLPAGAAAVAPPGAQTPAPPGRAGLSHPAAAPKAPRRGGPGPAGEIGKIVFSSKRSGQWRIWIMHADGSRMRQLTKAPRAPGGDVPDSHDVDPVFSPDGKHILFTSTRGGTTGIWRMPIDAPRPTRICDGDQAEWSPDGRKIAFRRKGRILTRDLKAGKDKTITPQEWDSCSGPAWSPDGKQIAIARKRKGRNGVFLLPAGGGQPVKVYDKQGACEPHWSPDGKWIVYETETHVGAIRPDGTKNRLITYFGGVQRYPRYSPDGKSVVFCQGASPRGPWEIYVIPSGGGTPRKLTEGDSDMYPHWK